MKTLFAILSILVVFLALPVSAAKKGKGHADESPEAKIVQVDALRIVLSLGKGGDEHVEYKINDQTKVTLNGSPVAARDLRPGMVCKVEAGQDKVATAIHAQDAPAHPNKHRVG